jgi:putative SOS response-associated peptidase YedK
MLTINADDHPLMKQFHKPQDEKRMVVILPEERYHDWLHAPLVHVGEFLQQYPEDWMVASAAQVSVTKLT